MNAKTLTIKTNDRITVTAQGRSFTGTVDTAQNYGGHSYAPADNWYIEFVDDYGHNHYWKQELDGGTVKLAK